MSYYKCILLFAAQAAFYVSVFAATHNGGIQSLEAQLEAAIKAEDYARVAVIKAELEPLYQGLQFTGEASRQLRRRSLDQGGDNCASAVTISDLPYCDTGTTLAYSGDYSGNCGSSAAPDVVYRYVTTTEEQITFSLCGSFYDTYLHVWRGCPTEGGVIVGCNDDFCSLQSCLTLTLEADYEYFVVVDGYGSSAGSYIFNAVPASMGCIATSCGWQNDDCEEATQVSTSAHFFGSTIGATNDFYPGNSNCPTSDGPGVWYKFAGQDSDVVVTLLSASVPHQVFFYCGCCNDLWCMWNSDCSAPFGMSMALEAGVTYWLLVAGCDGEEGTFELSIEYTFPAPIGGCGIAMDHDFTAPGEVSGTTCGQCNWCGLRPSEDALARVEIPYSGNWVFSLCSSSFDTYLYLGTEPCSNNIYQRDDTCGLRSTTPCLNLAAGTYFLTIEAWSSLLCGDYVLRVNPCPLPEPIELVIWPDFPDIVLTWSAPNGAVPANYRIYRSVAADNMVQPGNLIGTTAATTYTDPGVLVNPAEKFHYAVTANAP